VIGKQEIVERAAGSNLRPEVVEKDYVLGWLLAAASAHPVVSTGWVLKGGTCVKKCFFETYRFSEDLDFTLVPSAAYDEASLANTLGELAASASAMSGIRFPSEHISIKERHDKLGRGTFEGRVGYQGPLAFPSWPKVRFDLSRHEPILLTPVKREVIHPYSDQLPEGTGVLTYAFEELFAEKARALFERTRPRDLYDVAYILDNLEEPLDGALVRTTFRQKCAAKEFDTPTASAIVARVRESAELRADWDAMLTHQLPYATPVEGAIDRLDRALSWLAQDVPAQIVGTSSRLPTPPLAASGGQVAPRQMRGAALEQLRFAGSNRLLVGFNYNSKARIVEPYSLRWAKTTGNLLFYGWELATNQIKCFIVSRMGQVRVLETTFSPRFHIELGATGGVQRGAWRW
jgi:predicted nucleotidyltransferase component of viral defense system